MPSARIGLVLVLLGRTGSILACFAEDMCNVHNVEDMGKLDERIAHLAGGRSTGANGTVASLASEDA